MDVIETDRADVQVDSAGATSYVNNYKILNMLGQGTFSKVYLCQNDTGDEFALKVINKSILKRKREYKRVDGKLVLSNAFQKVRKEVAIMKKLAHSNLVRLYEVIDSPADDKLFLVLELIRGGQIMYWDDKKFRYSARNIPAGILGKDAVRECLRDVVAALDFLHHNHICHRDIKPENILLSGDQYKLADFGVAHMNEDEPSTAARAGDAAVLRLRSTEGTYHFLAPECTTGDEYDPYQVDVWALGVTMFTLLLGTLPFGSSVASLSDVMTSIREDPLILPPELDPECAELLTQLLEKNPHLRITIPQLKTHPWISRSSGELTRKPSGLEVIVTQQEIEAAFTPVNNFILVMKLKMKMSSRLNNVRKSLASIANGARRAEEIPVTKHVSVSSSQLAEGNSKEGSGLSVPKPMEMAPTEQTRAMADRLQRESSRLVETISEAVGSFTPTLGSISPVFDSAAPSVPSPALREDSPGKTNTNGRPDALLRKLSRRNTRSSIPDTPQRTDNPKTTRTLPSEENGDDLSTDKSDMNAAVPSSTSRTNSLVSLNNDKSPINRLAKRKSISFRGVMRAVEIPEGESASESTSPTNRKKRRESLPGKRDSSSDLSVQNSFDAVKSESLEVSSSKTAGCNSSSQLRLSRKKSMSFRTLVTTPELSACVDDGGLARIESSPAKPRADTIASDSPSSVAGNAGVSQTNGTSSTLLATTRTVILSRRPLRRKSRPIRALNILTDASQREEPANIAQTLPQTELSPSKGGPGSMDTVSCAGDHANVLSAANSPAKPGLTSPPHPLSPQLSRRNSMSLRVLVPTPEDPANGAGMNEEQEYAVTRLAVDGIGNTEKKSPNKLESRSPPKLSRCSSTSFRALPPTTDTAEGEESVKDGEGLAHKVLQSEISDTNSSVEGAASTKASTGAATSPQKIPPSSPLGSQKIMLSVHSDEQRLQPSRKAKLPVLDMQLSPVFSPVASPATSPRKTANFSDEETLDDSTPRRRSSSPSQTIGSVRFLESLKVSPRRPSSLNFLSISDGENKQPDLPNSIHKSTSSDVAPDAATEDPPSASSSMVKSPDHGSPDRRSTFSSKPTSPPRRLHRNHSMNSVEGDDPNGALTRKSSLAKVLDECITTGRSTDGGAEGSTVTAPTPEVAPHSEAVAPLTPPRRHQVQVPPLIWPEGQLGQQTDMSHERHQISPIGLIESSPQVVESGSKSPPESEKLRSRRKSLIQAQGSLHVLLRGKRLSVKDEKRGAHYTTAGKVATSKSEVCGIM